MKKRTVPYKQGIIEIDGLPYMNSSLFIDLFLMEDRGEMYKFINQKMPHKKHGGRFWFNESLCRKWFLGE